VSRLAVITGATGFIGWHAARQLQSEGWQVRALVRPQSTRPVPHGIERVTAALTEADIVAHGRGADVLVHMAAVVGVHSPREFRQSNVDATQEVARATRALGARLIHTSSLGATGPGDPANPPAESDPTRPINAYGESKLQSELAVKAVDGLDWTILRPSLVYGPRDRLFRPLFRLASRGLFFVPPSRAAYNLVHVHDVARCVQLAARSSMVSGETFFVGGSGQITAADLLAKLAIVFERPFRPIAVPRAAMRIAAEAGALAAMIGIRTPINRGRWRELNAEGFVCRVDKAREILGFAATTDLLDGLRTTAEWYRQHKLL
jgi:nucleoside-diphosphate-sugar epimerase